MLFHRATQVVGWSLPAMTLWYMKKGSEAHFGALETQPRLVSTVDTQASTAVYTNRDERK